MSENEAARGELFELKAELHSDKRDRKRDAVRKVISLMTSGKDVSQLFPDVMNCMNSDNLELKKLVYLYLINYAKSQPEMAVLAVSSLIKDSQDPSPLIRALAVRTMGGIRVEKIFEHLCEPLRRCLKDEDAYVRKTGAICVAKIYDLSPKLIEDQGFLDMLRDAVSDSNAMVVANAVAALHEISEKSNDSKIFDLNSITVNKLLTALNECTEWGQVFLLDSIVNYSPKEEKEAQTICERITPRLAHSNSAVVLSTVKVLMTMMNFIPKNSDFISNLYRKMAPPLVTLLSSKPEIQYVALRNINLILQKKPDLLKNEMKVFFVKYNDPIYVKMEKLDIMIRLTDQSNIPVVLAELKEYSSEIDVDFVRKSVRAIGRCAIKVQQAADRCVTTLTDLIQTQVNYVVQEAIIVIRDIFRKYPNKYESIIATLCDNLDTLDEPEARAAMIWIIGEYAERIDNAGELLENFLNNFKDETNQVQFQILTAVIKSFLKNPTTPAQELVTNVLKLVTTEIDNPDLRDRGYIYWRLLSTDPRIAKEVVLAEKALISEETDLLEGGLVEELMSEIGTIASVYHRPASSFVEGRFLIHRYKIQKFQTEQESSFKTPAPVVISSDHDLLGNDFDFIQNNQLPTSQIQTNSNLIDEDLSSILGPDINLPTSTTTQPTTNNRNLLEELFSATNLNNPFVENNFSSVGPKEIWLTAVKGKGLEISGQFARRNGEIQIEMEFFNRALQPLNDFALQINRNSFGLTPRNPLTINSSILPGQQVSAKIILNTNGVVMKIDPLCLLQIAVKNNIDVHYFNCNVPIHIFFVENGQIDKTLYRLTWQSMPDVNELKTQFQNEKNFSVDQIQKKLTLNNVHLANRTTIEQNEMLFQSIKLTNGILVLTELTFSRTNSVITLSLKSQVREVLELIAQIFPIIINNS